MYPNYPKSTLDTLKSSLKKDFLNFQDTCTVKGKTIKDADISGTKKNSIKRKFKPLKRSLQSEKSRPRSINIRPS